MPVISLKTGKEIQWAHTQMWNRHDRARWHKKTMYGGVVQGSIRAIAHIDWMDRRAIAIFGPGHGVEVIQSAFNTSVKASAGTHNLDMTYDLHIPGVSWWRQQQFFRNHGFWCWYRPTTAGLWLNHVHGFCMVPYTGDPSQAFMQRGFKVGVYIDGGWSTYGRLVTSSQVHDQVVHAFGLKDQHRAGSDRSYYPADPKSKIFDFGAYVRRRKAVQAAA